nr:TPM domain-containing protein [uncultured Anaerotignum sp.]
MKKKILGVLFSLILCLCAAVPAFAETEGFASEYLRVQDLAELLTEDQEAALLDKVNEISERQKMDIVILTVDSLEGEPVQDFADDFYDYCEFGYGEDRDGLLLLISMEERDCYISTCGYGITAFTDFGIDYICQEIVGDLGDENYAAAFDTYANLCDDFITQAREGKPFDKGSLPKEPLAWFWIPVSIGFGFVVALIVVGVMKSQLKTVRFQAAAGDYMKKGSLDVREKRDMFLYSNVSRTAKPKDNDSGGSSTHTSSSGTTHGGGGSKF